ncbi:hypothetical protein B5G28_05945 [Faecalibacterium sp. An77]|uniref:hypothetical protein n=1 Tax=Faecalibacterium sp. An77 TaxID=1965655 RepID=UPI000B37F255|nr:hypothetical protein [Faecalibacterium sp. An77]OUN39233.1 hypothetical protein B5G28_05945 [Faecalibacterium sp. An77]
MSDLTPGAAIQNVTALFCPGGAEGPLMVVRVKKHGAVGILADIGMMPQRERAGRRIRPKTPGAKNVAFWGLSARAGMIIMGLLKYKPVVKRRTA